MGSFHLSYDGDIIRIRAIGVLGVEESVAFIRENYPSLTAGRILYDFRNADQRNLSDSDQKRISKTVTEALPPRADRKTAFVVANSQSYSRVWKYINDAVEAKIRAEYSAFMDEESALRWLQSD